MLDFLFKGGIIGRIPIGAAFDDHRQRTLRSMAFEIGHDAHNAVGLRHHFGDDAVDGRRKDICPAHDQHIVGTSGATDFGAGPTAGAFGVDDLDIIT